MKISGNYVLGGAGRYRGGLVWYQLKVNLNHLKKGPELPLHVGRRAKNWLLYVLIGGGFGRSGEHFE